jgi:CheY-like chemotaxis protein
LAAPPVARYSILVTTAHRILVVEDDDDVRESLVQILTSAGFEVVPAASGEEALRQLGAGLRPCVILLDLMMPGMNGWQFIEEQRLRPGPSGTPVVVVSAYGSADGVRSVGAADYLRKPIDVDALLAVVGRYCSRATDLPDS